MLFTMETEHIYMESSEDKQRLRSSSVTSSRRCGRGLTLQHAQCIIQLTIAVALFMIAICGFQLLHVLKAGTLGGSSVPANTVPPKASQMASVSGPAGPQGPVGAPGVPGQHGQPGHVGSRGAKGDAGLPGDRGFPGLPGINGAPGNTGPRGEVGFHGIPGRPGVKGESGTIGTSGPVGPKGDMGPPGISGSDGSQNSSVEGFSLYRSKGRYDQSAVPQGPLHFGNVHFNLGSGLNLTTSVYTAPVRGLYFFTYCLRKDTGGDSDAFLYVNDVQVMITDNDIDEADVKAISGIVNLEQGDRVWVQMYSESKIYCYTDTNCRFDGYLLRPY